MTLVTLCLLYLQEEMSGESVVSSAVPAAATRTTSFKGTSPSSKYVKLNVGGALYYTTMQTLTKQDTMLKAMFSGRMEVLTDSEGKPTLRHCACASDSEDQHEMLSCPHSYRFLVELNVMCKEP